MFIFNLNVVFTTHVLKVRQSVCALAREILLLEEIPEGGFHGEEFAPAWFETIT
jgi:hypothetical protein